MARLTNLTDRGRETQVQLRDVLMALILEKGYDRVSIKDITERAQVDRSTFYLHFRDKDDLFVKSQRWMVDELLALRSQGRGPYPGITVTFEHMARNPRLYLAIWQAEGLASHAGSFEDYIATTLAGVLEGMLRERGIGAEGLLEPLSRYLAGALRSLARWWLETGMATSPAEMAGLFVRLAAGGLESLAPGPGPGAIA